SATTVPQRFALVQSDVIGLVALDLVLRIVRARMMDVALVAHVGRVDPYDTAADPASFGIPAYVIADLESLCHDRTSGPDASFLGSLYISGVPRGFRRRSRVAARITRSSETSDTPWRRHRPSASRGQWRSAGWSGGRARRPARS